MKMNSIGDPKFVDSEGGECVIYENECEKDNWFYSSIQLGIFSCVTNVMKDMTKK
ncbi:MAG: hypothetical protein LBI98_03185 [Endomicrobium sp.]|jgi:hypothetical protein|nr:hypothetical protein [Endomicrobium sp.]